MKKELAAGVIFGLLMGSGMVAPNAALKTGPLIPEMPQDARRTKEVNQTKPTTEGRALADYELIDKRDIFRPTMEPRAPQSLAAVPKFPVIEEQPWISPAQEWTFAGYAAIDDDMIAILHEPASGQAVFVREGDTFRGGRIEKITTMSIRLAFDEEIDEIYKSSEYNTVPLATAAQPPQRSRSLSQRVRQTRLNRQERSRSGGSPQNARAASDGAGTPGREAAYERAARMRAEWETRRRRLMEQRSARGMRNAAPEAPIEQEVFEDTTSTEENEDSALFDEFEIEPLLEETETEE